MAINYSYIKEKLRKSSLYRLINYDKTSLDEFARKINLANSTMGINQIRKKLKMAYIIYGCDYKTYYQCRCDMISLPCISEIVPWKEQWSLWKKINSKDARSLLSNKYICFEHFKVFYRRNVIFVKGLECKNKFIDFINKNQTFILKPIDMNCGKGIVIIDYANDDISVDELIALYPDGFVAEELIVQKESLRCFHPQSVNTLRINTVNYGNFIEIKWPCLRMGRGNNIVDNAGAGGVFGAIDVASGRVIAASDEFHHTFDVHPDTGVPIVGFKLPQWNEACEMAKQLAVLIPDCLFVGWDFAYTENGWVMVEGNYGPLLIWQVAMGRGIRKEFEIMRRKLTCVN